MTTYVPPQIEKGQFVDTTSGLIVPRSYANRSALILSEDYRSIPAQGWNAGTPLDRDVDTMVVRWPKKGSGWDDKASDLIVDGMVSNVGVAPVIAPMISALVQKQQNQAVAATIELTGRRTPVRRAREAIARFNDSPLGATSAMQTIVRNLRTYNRGAPLATVPIYYNMDEWEEYGLIAHQILNKGKSTGTYYLEVDWTRFGTPTPFLPNPYCLEPTGNRHWPYWYLAEMGTGKRNRKWVLLHYSQIIMLTPGESSLPGIGTSSVWMCLGKLAEEILVVDERIEKKISKMAEGLIGIGPVFQTAEQIKDAIEAQAIDEQAKGNVMAKGHHILTNPQKAIDFKVLAFRQHDGVEFKDRREDFEDTIAACFDEPLTSLVTRGGVGFGSQADTVADVGSEGGVMSILNRVAVALGTIYPTIQVAINRPNDRAQRLKVETFGKFAAGIRDLSSTGAVILSPGEIRGIVDREFIDIPETSDDITTMTATRDDPEDKERVSTDAPEQPESEEPTPPPEDDEDNDERNAVEAALQLCRLNEWYVARMEPVVPDGADEALPQIAPNPETVSTSEFDQYWPDEYGEMLEAEVVEGDSVEDAAEGDSKWLWLLGLTTPLLLYITRDETREVDRQQAVILRNEMVDQRLPRLEELAALLAAGVISLAEYNRLLKQRTEESWANEGRLGRGGENAMTVDDWAILRLLLGQEFESIDNFTERIGQGIYSEAQISNYSRNFIHGSVQAYERMNAKAHGLMASLPQYPGDCQTQCCKGCKCSLRYVRLTGEQNFDVYWLLGRAEHCPDCLRLNAVWSPLRVRNGEIQ